MMSTKQSEPRAPQPQPQVNYQNYSMLPSAPMPEMIAQGQSSPFMIDASGLGPQMDPTTIAAGYGRKTPRGLRPNPYAMGAGYQPNLTFGGEGGFNG